MTKNEIMLREVEILPGFEGVVTSKYPYQPESKIDIKIKNKWNDLIPIIIICLLS